MLYYTYYIIYYYILYYYTIIIIYYTIIHILYYTLLLFSSILSFPFSSFPILSSSSIPIFFLFHLLFYSFPSHSQPFYTCRYLHLLIYIPFFLFSSDLSPSVPLPLLFFPFPIIGSISSYPLPNIPFPYSIPIFILYLSVVPYTYLCSPIFPPIFHQLPKYLTPHVLSEWMVEV